MAACWQTREFIISVSEELRPILHRTASDRGALYRGEDRTLFNFSPDPQLSQVSSLSLGVSYCQMQTFMADAHLSQATLHIR